MPFYINFQLGRSIDMVEYITFILKKHDIEWSAYINHSSDLPMQILFYTRNWRI